MLGIFQIAFLQVIIYKITYFALPSLRVPRSMAEPNIVSTKTNFKDFAFLKIEACKLLRSILLIILPSLRKMIRTQRDHSNKQLFPPCPWKCLLYRTRVIIHRKNCDCDLRFAYEVYAKTVTFDFDVLCL